MLNEEYGITGKALSWFQTYLVGRTQYVKIGPDKSEQVPLWCGGPQGSVLGPVMFTLYTTPLQRIMDRYGIRYHKYADDTQVYVIFYPSIPGSLEDALRRLSACITEIRSWMMQKWLRLNDDKL